jgi:hypothetical protein
MTTSIPTAEPMGGSAESTPDETIRSTGVRGTHLRSHRSGKSRTVGAIVIASILAALYLLFVIHYSVNVIFWDEWVLVPVIHAALHSHLTLGALWTQHNENRIFVQNLVVVASALIHNYDSKAIILIGALLFIASYALLLAVFRSYVGRPLVPMHTLTLGIVWFSLADTENALWGFQLGWYLIIFFLMVLMFLLAREWSRRNLVLALGILAAVAASYSSLQGLILWPVGLICLLWDRPLTRRRYFECGIWLAFCALTTAFYFRGFQSQYAGSPGFALHHPLGMLKFFFAMLGNVVPTTNTDLRAHELLGLVLFIPSVCVVVASLRDRTSRIRNPLPVTLIVFGVLFDGSTVLGRLTLGIGAALATRYTMANLLVLLGIVAFAWAHVRPSREARARGPRFTTTRRVGLALLAIFLLAQLVTATRFGIISGRATRSERLIDARTLVNLDRIPLPERQQLITAFVYPSVAGLDPLLQEARQDHLSVFAPGPYRFYRSKGPPTP